MKMKRIKPIYKYSIEVKLNMDNIRKSTTTYRTDKNTIIIKNTKYYKRKCIIITKSMNIIDFRKYENEKTYTKKQKNKKQYIVR